MIREELIKALITEQQKAVIYALKELCIYSENFDVEPIVDVRVKSHYGNVDVDVTIHPGGNVENNIIS